MVKTKHVHYSQYIACSDTSTDLLISDLWIALAPPDQCGQESSTRLSWKKKRTSVLNANRFDQSSGGYTKWKGRLDGIFSTTNHGICMVPDFKTTSNEVSLKQRKAPLHTYSSLLMKSIMPSNFNIRKTPPHQTKKSQQGITKTAKPMCASPPLPVGQTYISVGSNITPCDGSLGFPRHIIWRLSQNVIRTGCIPKNYNLYSTI